MIIQDFKFFHGQHCETTATGSLLYQLGIELSEPMLFGLGEGLGYIFWNMKTMGFPFIGGRVKTDVLTQNLCRNLDLELEVKETSSVSKAWQNVKEYIDQGKAVGLKLDCYHLDYFTNKIHFAGHYATMYGYDEENAFLNDTYQQGRDTRTSLKNLELARNERGPMSSRNRSFVINRKGEMAELSQIIRKAIHNNAIDFLNPPIKNVGYKGIHKTSIEILKWYNSSSNLKNDFQTSATLMERGGTGGSLFRNLYRDFLKESADVTGEEAYMDASRKYAKIALKWKEIAELFILIGESGEVKYVNGASALLKEISRLERETMKFLLEAT